MQRFKKPNGLVVPLDMAHVDTDQLLPKQFLTRVERDGWGQYLFYNLRHKPDGSVNPDFVLNRPGYAGASVLLGRENFGSGSSREHAPWALYDYGFRVVIAHSFADIFFNNSSKVGLLLIRLDAQMLDEWFRRTEGRPGYRIDVDLKGQSLTGSDGFACMFSIDPDLKHRLLEGLDDIGMTLEQETAINAYEAAHDRTWQAAVNGVPRPAPPKEFKHNLGFQSEL